MGSGSFKRRRGCYFKGFNAVIASFLWKNHIGHTLLFQAKYFYMSYNISGEDL